MQWILKKRQTHTDIHSQAEAIAEKEAGRRSALRSMAAVQLGAQLILWVTFYGYDRTSQTVWQAALMLFLPILVLWFLWKKSISSLQARSARFLLLPLLLCLFTDAAFLLYALGGFISQLMPQYPSWLGVIIPAIFGYLTALWSGRRGVSYGLSLMKMPLMILLVFGTVFLRASSRADRLWPILGQGIGSTALAALNGSGSVWSVSLLFLFHSQDNPQSQKSVGWALTPWVLCVLWALWYGFVRPWFPGDSLAVGEKMMGLARHASSVVLYEVAGLMWMLLIPSALTACFSTAERFLTAAVPRCPYMLALLVLPLLVCALLLWKPGQIPGWIETLGPWRTLISLLCGLGLLLAGRRDAACKKG